MSVRRVFDYRLIVATTVLLLVVYFVFTGLKAGSRSDALVRSLRAQQTLSAASRTAATTQREELLKQNRLLLSQVARVDARSARLLEYLRTQGIDVPPTYDTPAQRGSAKTPRQRPSVTSSGSSATQGGETSQGETSTPSPRTEQHSTPTPETPEPTPPSLGNTIRDLTKGLIP